jgi:hypothetical protein
MIPPRTDQAPKAPSSAANVQGEDITNIGEGFDTNPASGLISARMALAHQPDASGC